MSNVRHLLDDRPEHIITAYQKLSVAIGALEHLRVSPIYDYKSFQHRIAPRIEELKRERDVLWNSINR